MEPWAGVIVLRASAPRLRVRINGPAPALLYPAPAASAPGLSAPELKETAMAVLPNPDPAPAPVPTPPPLPEPKPVREPDPERLPDEEPLPNPDENDVPPKHSAARARHGIQAGSA